VQEKLQERFDEHRKFLFSIAYRMLGSVTEAEDLVQETFLRWRQAAVEEVESPKAYLATIITRLCINHLNSARVRRERYVGPWLPEPALTSLVEEPLRAARMAESLTLAFLILLESLSPVERAVLLLREVFDYDYAEIAPIVGKTEANCRQILKRARAHIADRRARFDVSPREQERLMERFAQAAGAGDMDGLLALLAEDVTLWADGGGKAVAALRPVRGRAKVARFIIGALGKLVPPDKVSRLLEVNGQPGIVNYVADEPHSVVIIDAAEERVWSVYVITNPEKLAGVFEQ